MEKFRDKYRIPSARLANWDYSRPGFYFITICTKNRIHFFGEIIKGEMHLNETGLIANTCWAGTPAHFNHTRLGEFVIMPNHVHGIIIIDDPVTSADADSAVETGHALSLRSSNHPRFRNPGKNTISSMVGSFKSAVTRLSRPVHPEFGWQTRFYDHIIRDHRDLVHISHYILNNPANWKEDRFYK
jgi:putative transposase